MQRLGIHVKKSRGDLLEDNVVLNNPHHSDNYFYLLSFDPDEVKLRSLRDFGRGPNLRMDDRRRDARPIVVLPYQQFV